MTTISYRLCIACRRLTFAQKVLRKVDPPSARVNVLTNYTNPIAGTVVDFTLVAV